MPPPRSSTTTRLSLHAQPKAVKLSWRALLTFPYRLCNPPPAVGKVRSCQVTPAVSIKLDHVLDRTHLPPLGLKDFEEWLLFVEQCPENLYFILWLKEYTTRYDQWVMNTDLSSDSQRHLYVPSKQYHAVHALDGPKTNPSLGIFYARAKQTFFTPSSPYELNLPSDILGPFHSQKSDHFDCNDDYNSHGVFSPHPDPAVFHQVEQEVRAMLEESLDQFVKATFSNVGTNRAMCGIVGGIFILLLGTVAPIVENFVNGRSRWLRLLAFPGAWLGFTVLVASLHGLCMMIYLFGDLRQLRSFELSRPAISPPQPLRNDMSWFSPPTPRKKCTSPVPSSPPGSLPITRPPINIPKAVYTAQPNPRLMIVTSPPESPIGQPPVVNLSPTKTPYRDRYIGNVLVVDPPRLSFPSSSSVTTSSNELNQIDTASSSHSSHAIYISEAYYDDQVSYPGAEPISSPVPSSWNSPSPDPIRSRPIWAANAHPMPTNRVLPVLDNFASGEQAHSDVWTTASFIHPYEFPPSDDELHLEYDGGDEQSRTGAFSRAGKRDAAYSSRSRVGSISMSRTSSLFLASERQRMDSFDFDALPRVRPEDRKIGGRPRYRKCDASEPPPLLEDDRSSVAGVKKILLGPKDILRKIQGRCVAVRDTIQIVLSRRGQGYRERLDEEMVVSEKGVISANRNSVGGDVGNNVAATFSKVKDVPAFKSPLTKILSPVVTRAQWEIAVRSAMLGFILTWSLLAGFLAAPVIY